MLSVLAEEKGRSVFLDRPLETLEGVVKLLKTQFGAKILSI